MKPRSKAKRAGSRTRPQATTAEVVPDLQKEVAVPPKWRTYYNRLLGLRSYLEQSRGTLKSDVGNASPRYSLHMADAATDNFDRDFALSMLSSEQDAIYEIDQALNRIAEGTYGICEMTGKPIPKERLDAIPWARFAAEAEEELERRGDVAKAKLGDVARVPKESTEGGRDEE